MVVSHEHSESHKVIDRFEDSDDQWIIAIGMVSEGTNIPRLQVCCYLSRIKTELYFRQVLGRIVRAQEECHPYAYFYTLAEATLLEYATRIGDDLPDELLVLSLIYSNLPNISNFDDHINSTPVTDRVIDETLSLHEASSANNQIFLSGQFSEELILLQHSFNKAC